MHRTYQLQGNFTGSTLTLSQYKYNGPSRLVETSYSQNSVHSRMDLADGDGTYEHLDRFGRVKTKDWRQSSTIKDQFNYTHDYAGNRLTRDVPTSVYSTNDLDHAYAYDDRHRLTNFDEGSLSGGSIASPKAEQDWALSDYDNWDGLVEKTNGSTTLNQARTHNRRNELTEVDSSTTHVAHDDAGNMTKLPKPGNWSSHYDLVYDAWNRLMEVKDGAVTVARYEYDALNRRIVKTAGSDTYHYYYNTAWQMLEVRKDGVSNPVEQYVWHPYYIDALAVRYRDANTDGDYNDSGEVHFPTHDANFNVTALLDSSGSVVERYTYSPYGQLTVRDPSFAIDADGKSDFANPYTYTGRRFDEETGLYQYRNRYYDPQLGRFVTRDPTGFDGSPWNLYEYVDGRPITAADPIGTAKFNFVGDRGRLEGTIQPEPTATDVASDLELRFKFGRETWPLCNGESACTDIGFIQVMTYEKIMYGEHRFNSKWFSPAPRVDGSIPYSQDTGVRPHRGNPVELKKPNRGSQIVMTDSPGAQYNGTFGWPDVVHQRFETCVVCLDGVEGPKLDTYIRSDDSRAGLGTVLESLTVYGCVTWGHYLRRDQSQGDLPIYTSFRWIHDQLDRRRETPVSRPGQNVLSTPVGFTGVKPGRRWKKVVDDYYSVNPPL